MKTRVQRKEDPLGRCGRKDVVRRGGPGEKEETGQSPQPSTSPRVPTDNNTQTEPRGKN